MAHGLGERVVVSTFDLETFLRLRRCTPACATSLLFETPEHVRDGLSPRRLLQAALVLAAQAGPLASTLITPSIDQTLWIRAARLGLGVLAWTVDDEQEMRRLASLGVEAILSNTPDVLRRQVLPIALRFRHMIDAGFGAAQASSGICLGEPRATAR